MSELDLEEEKAFLIENTRCSEDEAWNFLIAEESFFEEKESAGEDLAAIDDEELFGIIAERTGMEPALVKKLSEAEILFFEKNGIE